ncbi:PHD-zinc-finger like domain-containing protein [Limtongia smithiae]|uniref:PHD-zinc-finger like domain-containing protein n=1 Tax=Limtongia smithiae TaxID=1125753 RepID=UPI0034CEA639
MIAGVREEHLEYADDARCEDACVAWELRAQKRRRLLLLDADADTTMTTMGETVAIDPALIALTHSSSGDKDTVDGDAGADDADDEDEDEGEDDAGRDATTASESTTARVRERSLPVQSRTPARPTATTPAPASTTNATAQDDRPREERSYKEFHPDLTPEMPLAFVDGPPVAPTNGSSRIRRGRSTRPGARHTLAAGTTTAHVELKKPVFRELRRTHHGAAADDGEELFSASYRGERRRTRFVMPEHYIRSERIDMEPEDPDTVEYDMDEQDDQFLIIINEERRRKYSATPISRMVFEVIMTKLEKEWFALQTRMPRRARGSGTGASGAATGGGSGLSSGVGADTGEGDAESENDESRCAICDDGECENSNAIVFCDGCNVAVHQDCYGVPFIPEGQWFCRRCMAGVRRGVGCIFCPSHAGAFKQTDTGAWAHLLCALWIMEVGIGNTVYMEPIEGVSRVPRQRWKLVCYICKQKQGACIQCTNKSCYSAFHVTCARRAGLQLKLKSTVAAGFEDHRQLEAYCERHCDAEYLALRDVKGMVLRAQNHYAALAAAAAEAAEKRRELPRIRLNLTSLTARTGPTKDVVESTVSAEEHEEQPKGATRVVWKTNLGAPVVPHVIYRRVCDAVAVYGIVKRKEAVATLCRYWSLKKELRRGATLLRRLQVASESMPDKEFRDAAAAARKLEFARVLREDLAKLVRMAEVVVERERVLGAMAGVVVEAQAAARGVVHDSTNGG